MAGDIRDQPVKTCISCTFHQVDIGNGFFLNQLNFGGSAVTLNGNGIAFTNNGGAMPQLNQNSGNGFTINNNLILATNTTFGGSGSGGMTFSGVISGPGSLTKANSAGWSLNVANTYSGGTVISGGGDLSLSGSSPFFLAMMTALMCSCLTTVRKGPFG